MGKFKVGDYVIFNQEYVGHPGVNIVKGDTGIVTKTEASIVYVRPDRINKERTNPIEVGVYSYRVDAIPPKEQAIKLLEAEGYTITPPKPKKTGWVNIYHWVRDGRIDERIEAGFLHPTRADADRVAGGAGWAGGRIRLACIQWTEGDGLDETV